MKWKTILALLCLFTLFNVFAQLSYADIASDDDLVSVAYITSEDRINLFIECLENTINEPNFLKTNTLLNNLDVENKPECIQKIEYFS